MMNSSTPKEKENPVVTLRAQAEKFGFIPIPITGQTDGQ